ncbi:hypothetical protein [Chitinimonas naiadis]
MEPGRKLKVSLKLFVLNVLGALLAALGLSALVGRGTNLHPLLSAWWVGLVLLLVGLVLMGWFMVDIFKRIRAQQSAR